MMNLKTLELYLSYKHEILMFQFQLKVKQLMGLSP